MRDSQKKYPEPRGGCLVQGTQRRPGPLIKEFMMGRKVKHQKGRKELGYEGLRTPKRRFCI